MCTPVTRAVSSSVKQHTRTRATPRRSPVESIIRAQHTHTHTRLRAEGRSSSSSLWTCAASRPGAAGGASCTACACGRRSSARLSVTPKPGLDGSSVTWAEAHIGRRIGGGARRDGDNDRRAIAFHRRARAGERVGQEGKTEDESARRKLLPRATTAMRPRAAGSCAPVRFGPRRGVSRAPVRGFGRKRSSVSLARRGPRPRARRSDLPSRLRAAARRERGLRSTAGCGRRRARAR